ncbi:MAG: ribonuclease activity regulator RraA [Actinobacteria bacterium]|nr:ribonuclease activity regulator RraA [Actinomycetota bacterium]
MSNPASFTRPVPLDEESRALLAATSTATLTSQLLKRGLRRTFLAGLRPTRPDLRMVGYACTIRYVPSREDLGFHVDYDNSRDLQRIAVESVGAEDVLVIDARGQVGAASFGHIIATRIGRRGAAGLVTDGGLRDSPGFASLDLPAYYRAPHATTSSVLHHPVDLDVPIGCAEVYVAPGDIVVGDAEGVVVIPSALAAEVARDAAAQEEAETFALERVRAGEPIADLYPLADSRRAEFEAWARARRSAGR